MRDFSYACATTRADALTLAQLPDAAVLAGGTELLNWFRIGITKPERVVDISRVPEMDRIEALPCGGLPGLTTWRNTNGSATLIPSCRRRF
jgi:xanthine dehydrogenase YagS FAD-binding subunit